MAKRKKAKTKLCSNCGKYDARPHQRWCVKCHTHYMEGWRAQRVTVKINDLCMRCRKKFTGGSAPHEQTA